MVMSGRPQEAQKMLTEVGADAVMIGRAALGNPWIVKQTVEYLAGKPVAAEPTPAEKIQVAKEHLHRLVALKGGYIGPREFRTQAAYYLKGIPRSAKAKAALNAADTEEKMIEIFDCFQQEAEEFIAKRAARRAKIG